MVTPQNNWQSWIELPPCLSAWSTMCKVIIPRGAPINKEDKWKTDINQKQVKQAQISKTWNGKRSFLVGQKHAKLLRGDKNDSDYILFGINEAGGFGLPLPYFTHTYQLITLPRSFSSAKRHGKQSLMHSVLYFLEGTSGFVASTSLPHSGWVPTGP